MTAPREIWTLLTIAAVLFKWPRDKTTGYLRAISRPLFTFFRVNCDQFINIYVNVFEIYQNVLNLVNYVNSALHPSVRGGLIPVNRVPALFR